MRPNLTDEQEQQLLEMAESLTRRQQQAEKYPEEIRDFVEFLLTSSGVLNHTERRAGWRYNSYAELVLDLGQHWIQQIIVPDFIGPMEPNQCFLNAYNLAVEVPELTYVEGYAQSTMMVTPHAWVLDKDGAVIDPTWANLDHLETSDKIRYYGVRFSTNFVVNRAEQSGWVSVLKSDWMLDGAALRFGLDVDETGLVVGGRIE